MCFTMCMKWFYTSFTAQFVYLRVVQWLCWLWLLLMVSKMYIQWKKSPICVASCSAEQRPLKVDGVTPLIWCLSFLHFGFSPFPSGQHCQDGLQLFKNIAHLDVKFIKVEKPKDTSLHVNQPRIPKGIMFMFGKTLTQFSLMFTAVCSLLRDI